MKKMLSILLVSALAMGLLVTGTLAAGHWGGGSCRNNSLCYQDADGDGVCDNHGANCNYVDANGDGICDNQGQGYGQGHHRGGHHGGGCWN